MKKALGTKLIIDFHAHAFPEAIAEKAIENLESHYQIEIPNGGQIEELLASMEEAGVDKGVLLAAATNPQQVKASNDWLIQHKSERLISFGTLHPDYDDYLCELDRLRLNEIRGIKFHSDFQQFDIDNPKMWPIYEAIDKDFVVLFHVGDERLEYSSPQKLMKVIRNFPGMKIVAAHLGGYMRWHEVKEILIGTNIYLDTSSTFWRLPKSEVAEIILRHGCEKILFGTDYPIKRHSEEVGNILDLPLTDEEKSMILGSNGARLLGI